MGWNIWDLWEYRGRKRSEEGELSVVDSGSFEIELDFVPEDFSVKFVDHPDFDYDDQNQPSCVPRAREHLRIKSYNRLLVITWTVISPKRVHWEAST